MKRLISLSILFVLFAFISNTSAQQILHGTFKADINSEGFTLDKNSGDRIYTMYVKFEKGFEKTPSIILGVNKLDSSKDTNTRFEVMADGVSRDGFTIKIKTWSDSKIFGIGGNWIAFPEQ